MRFSSVLAGQLLLALRVAANVLLTLDAIESEIQTELLMRNLGNLQRIAEANGGNRAAGLAGYDASADYVLERAQRFADQLDFYVQPYNKTVYTVNSLALTGPDGEDVFVLSPTANIASNITGELVDTPVDDTIGSMCEESQYAGVNVVGKIALVKRGICGFITKLELAASQGAAAVVMYNSPASGTNYTGPDVGAPLPGDIVPVGIVPLETGEAWKARLAAGETLSVTLQVDSSVENKTADSVVAETKIGDADSVIMLGAHLDSVRAGPGINDDGSGVTALMEIMEAFTKYVGWANKVRFAWWAAEEDGLLGSFYYTSQLSAEDASKIKFYFNYDMIGSIVPQYWVYNTSTADQFGAQEIYEYIAAQGKAAISYGAWTNDSDYVGFLDLGVPVSGIFTGAGAPEDPCYHAACDTTDNINTEALTINSRAAARAAARLALSLEGLPAPGARDEAGGLGAGLKARSTVARPVLGGRLSPAV